MQLRTDRQTDRQTNRGDQYTLQKSTILQSNKLPRVVSWKYKTTVAAVRECIVLYCLPRAPHGGDTTQLLHAKGLAVPYSPYIVFEVTHQLPQQVDIIYNVSN